MQGNDNYYTNDKYKCPDSVRIAEKVKYPEKEKVWVAKSNRGISKPLFRPSKSEPVNSDIHIYEHVASNHEFLELLNTKSSRERLGG